jgi:ribose 5-phosphate isomerase A
MMSELSSFFRQVDAYEGGTGSQDQAKKAAADKILDLVESGMTLGLGTGSTVEFFLQGLALRIQDGLAVAGVPTSSGTERRARELGIPLLEPEGFPLLKNDICVDGADRVDLRGHLIKGGGGALLREKLVASSSSMVCILVDPSKLVPVFDHTFSLPVECVPFGIQTTIVALTASGCEASLRQVAKGQPLVTDNGNFIVDCSYQLIPDPEALLLRLTGLPGVVEVGIFSNLLDRLVVGFPNGTALEWSSDTGLS